MKTFDVWCGLDLMLSLAKVIVVLTASVEFCAVQYIFILVTDPFKQY